MRAPAKHAGRLLIPEERRMLRWQAQDLEQRIARAGGCDPVREAQLASIRREQQNDRDSRPRKRGKREARA